MAIESKTPAVREELRRRMRIAVGHMQRICQDEALTAAQAAPVDAALASLGAAMVAAGVGGVAPLGV